MRAGALCYNSLATALLAQQPDSPAYLCHIIRPKLEESRTTVSGPLKQELHRTDSGLIQIKRPT
jgi:hypothetical protein